MKRVPRYQNSTKVFTHIDTKLLLFRFFFGVCSMGYKQTRICLSVCVCVCVDIVNIDGCDIRFQIGESDLLCAALTLRLTSM